jgi:hypothetical protein
VKLLDLVRQTIRLRHYTTRTQESYVRWIWKFILFCEKRHSEERRRGGRKLVGTPTQDGAPGFALRSAMAHFLAPLQGSQEEVAASWYYASRKNAHPPGRYRLKSVLLGPRYV